MGPERISASAAPASDAASAARMAAQQRNDPSPTGQRIESNLHGYRNPLPLDAGAARAPTDQIR